MYYFRGLGFTNEEDPEGLFELFTKRMPAFLHLLLHGHEMLL